MVLNFLNNIKIRSAQFLAKIFEYKHFFPNPSTFLNPRTFLNLSTLGRYVQDISHSGQTKFAEINHQSHPFLTIVTVLLFTYIGV
jgi:hypothetical protein